MRLDLRIALQSALASLGSRSPGADHPDVIRVVLGASGVRGVVGDPFRCVLARWLLRRLRLSPGDVWVGQYAVVIAVWEVVEVEMPAAVALAVSLFRRGAWPELIAPEPQPRPAGPSLEARGSWGRG